MLPENNEELNSHLRLDRVYTVDHTGTIIDEKLLEAEYITEMLPSDIPLELGMIPGGTFLMGSPKDEEGSGNSEWPQHEVTIQEFAMGKYPITQAQWKAVMGNNPSVFEGDCRPVETVGWNAAVEFCEKLSELSRKEYRLPSESEWEYACRAGTSTPFYFGDTITSDLVNFNGTRTYLQAPEGEYREQITDMGSFPPNAYGLFDMHGNVWEWCLDHWHDNYNGAPTDGSAWVYGGDTGGRIVRGGSWGDAPASCRSAFRGDDNPSEHYNDNGFRVVCVLPRIA